MKETQNLLVELVVLEIRMCSELINAKCQVKLDV